MTLESQLGFRINLTFMKQLVHSFDTIDLDLRMQVMSEHSHSHCMSDVSIRVWSSNLGKLVMSEKFKQSNEARNVNAAQETMS